MFLTVLPVFAATFLHWTARASVVPTTTNSVIPQTITIPPGTFPVHEFTNTNTFGEPLSPAVNISSLFPDIAIPIEFLLTCAGVGCTDACAFFEISEKPTLSCVATDVFQSVVHFAWTGTGGGARAVSVGAAGCAELVKVPGLNVCFNTPAPYGSFERLTTSIPKD